MKKIRGGSRKSKSNKHTQIKRKIKSKKQSQSKHRQSIVFEGENCQFVDFGTVNSSGNGCVDGTKMVLKNKYDFNRKVRRDLMDKLSSSPIHFIFKM